MSLYRSGQSRVSKLILRYILTSLLTYLLMCISATLGSYKIITFPGSTDWRIEGVDQSGWTRPDFSFSDPYILGWSSKVIMTFETVRPKEAGAALVTFSNAPEKGIYNITREPLDAPLSGGIFKGSSFEAEVINPFPSEGSGGQFLGAKLKKLALSPRFGLFFLSPLEFVSLILIVPFLSSLLEYFFKQSNSPRLRFLPTAGCLFLALILFSTSRPDHWNRSIWLWGILLVLMLGALLAGRLSYSKQDKSSNWFIFFAVITFLFALWIRISAVSFGLPQLYHPDESRKVKISLRIATTGDLDPRYFRHPSFMLYSTAALGKAYQWIKGESPSLPQLLVLGRSVSAVLGAASVVVVFFIGTLLFGTSPALLAAGLLAVSPLHVVCSRYIKEDASMIFFSLLSLYFSLRFLFRAPKLYLLIASALFAGFATSTKYTGILSLVFPLMPIGFWIIENSRLQKLVGDRQELNFLKSISIKTVIGWILLVGMVTAIGFLLITPYSILNYSTFISDFSYEKAHMDRGHAGAISGWAYYWTYHLRFSVLGALTKPIGWVGILALGFLIPGIKKSAKYLIIFAAFFLFYFPAEYVNAKPFPQPERYILPCIPFLALAIGCMIDSLCLLAPRKLMPSAYITSFLILLLPPLLYSIEHTNSALHDTRQEATAWVNSNLENGSKILSDWYFYGPDFRYDKFQITQLKSPQGTKCLKKFSLQMLKEEKFDYYITSSFFYQRYIRQVKRGNKIAIGYKELFENIRPIKVFSNERYQYGFHNPTIKVFKIPK